MDGIALASVITSGVVGLGGLVLAGVSGKADRKHQRDMATQERQQQRLADAYVCVLEVCEQAGRWASQVRPVIDTSPPQEPPPLPTLEDQGRVAALLGAFGSAKVRDLHEAWRQTVLDIIKADQTVGLALANVERRGETGIDYMDVWRALDAEMRPAERAARQALTEQIARELEHRTG